MIDHLLQSDAKYPQRKSLKELYFPANRVRVNYAQHDAEDLGPDSRIAAAEMQISSYRMGLSTDDLTAKDYRTMRIWDMVASGIHVLGIDWGAWRQTMDQGKTGYLYIGSLIIFSALAVTAWQYIDDDMTRLFSSGTCICLYLLINNRLFSTVPFRLSIEGGLFREPRGQNPDQSLVVVRLPEASPLQQSGQNPDQSLVVVREKDFSTGAIACFKAHYGISPAELRRIELTVNDDCVLRETVQYLLNDITVRRQALEAQTKLETQAGLQWQAGFSEAQVKALMEQAMPRFDQQGARLKSDALRCGLAGHDAAARIMP